jgi:atypical dual specificity phosphatase
MWTWSLNWGEITPELVIGSCPMTVDDLERIRVDADVSAVLSVQHDECLAYWSIDYEAMLAAGQELGLAMDRCPIRDFDIADMRRRLPAAIGALHSFQARKHRTYVHCTAGLGRAPLTVLGYLTLVAGHDPEEVIQWILRGRPGAVPAWEAYRGCIADLVERHRKRIERQAYRLFERGVPGDAQEHWRLAQAEVLKAVLANHESATSRP